jgi:hypothetical protein
VTAVDGAARVRADLRLQVGDVSAHLVGDGASLRLVTDDAGGLAAALLDSAAAVDSRQPRRRLAGLGRTLDEAGVSIDLVGERGIVATVGHNQRSRIVRLLTGVDHVRLGRVRVVVPTAVRLFRHSKRAH